MKKSRKKKSKKVKVSKERKKIKKKVRTLHRWYLDNIYRWAKQDKENEKNLSYIG